MRSLPSALLFGLLCCANIAALAQTTAPVQPTPAPSAVGELANWWWIIVVVVVVALVIGLLARRRRGR